jgi:AraC family transcriptional regulator
MILSSASRVMPNFFCSFPYISSSLPSASFKSSSVSLALVGQSPKPYSLQLRLETAFHYLVIQPDKSVQEIGFDSGFTTPSLFSRAIKKYFGHSPEQIRRLPHAQQMRLLHGKAGQPTLQRESLLRHDFSADRPEIRVVRKGAVQGCYVLAPFDAPTKITAAFQVLERYAGQMGLPVGESGAPLCGIITPHLRNSYRAFLPLSADKAGGLPLALPLPLTLPGSRIEGGLFACFPVTGDLRHTNKVAHYFYRQWLPASGYRIAGIAGFETFGQNPASVSYHELQRYIHIPVEPIR